MNNVFETPRLIFRKVTPKDLGALHAILGDPDVMHFSPTGVMDKQSVGEYITTILSDYQKYGYGLWSVIYKENDQLIGLAGLRNQRVKDKSYVEISYRFAKKYWGMGFASETLNAITQYAFSTLHMDTLICIIEPGNEASIRVATKAGMEKIDSTKWYKKDVDIYMMEASGR